MQIKTNSISRYLISIVITTLSQFSMASNNIGLKHQNSGIKLFTTNTIYSSELKQSLDIALSKYEQLLYQPHKQVNLYLVKSKLEADQIRVQKAAQKGAVWDNLILSLEEITLKNKGTQTKFSIINHEICHIWFIHTLNSKGVTETKSKMGMPSYGHSSAADWIDESVATQCEISKVASDRIQKQHTPKPLEEYLNQEHPTFYLMKEQMKAIFNKGKGKQTVTTIHIDDDKLKNSLIHFYEQATWLRMYLISSLGPDAYRFIVDSLTKHKEVNSSLLNKLNYTQWQQADKAFNDFINDHIKKHKT